MSMKIACDSPLRFTQMLCCWLRIPYHYGRHSFAVSLLRFCENGSLGFLNGLISVAVATTAEGKLAEFRHAGFCEFGPPTPAEDASERHPPSLFGPEYAICEQKAHRTSATWQSNHEPAQPRTDITRRLPPPIHQTNDTIRPRLFDSITPTVTGLCRTVFI